MRRDRAPRRRADPTTAADHVMGGIDVTRTGRCGPARICIPNAASATRCPAERSAPTDTARPRVPPRGNPRSAAVAWCVVGAAQRPTRLDAGSRTWRCMTSLVSGRLSRNSAPPERARRKAPALSDLRRTLQGLVRGRRPVGPGCAGATAHRHRHVPGTGETHGRKTDDAHAMPITIDSLRSPLVSRSASRPPRASRRQFETAPNRNDAATCTAPPAIPSA